MPNFLGTQTHGFVYWNQSNPLIHIGSQVYLLLVSGVRKGHLLMYLT